MCAPVREPCDQAPDERTTDANTLGRDFREWIRRAQDGDVQSQAFLTGIRDATIQAVKDEADALGLSKEHVDEILSRIPDRYWLDLS